ncbi:MAG: protein translocase subunit SecD [Actinomycetota bacterium]
MTSKRYRTYLAVALLVAFGGLAAVVVTDTSPALGLDLEGGTSVLLSAEGEGVDEEAVNKTVEIIRQRIDGLGVAEAEVTAQGSEAIQVQLPGVEDENQALEVIGTTAQLNFRQVEQIYDTARIEALKRERDRIRGGKGKDDKGPRIPDVPEITEAKDSSVNDETVVYPDVDDPDLLYELKPAVLAGTAIEGAQAVLDPQTQQWSVDLDMTSDAGEKWADFTSRLACLRDEGEQVKDQVAIVLDGEVQTATGMADPAQAGGGSGVACGSGIEGGRSQIDMGVGGDAEAEAKDLALVLRYGSLPITLVQESVSKVSPTLGSDSLKAGVQAGLLGLALVLIYVVLYYRSLGFIVWGGLVLFAATNYTILALLGAGAGLSLSLAGIAGFIVSIGVTADSYIVIFERLKDEAKAGKSVRATVDRGTARALKTIVVADIVTASAAIILFFLAVGPVKGFALTLGLATLVDLLIAYFYTRPVLGLMGRTKRYRSGRFIGMKEPVGVGS